MRSSFQGEIYRRIQLPIQSNFQGKREMSRNSAVLICGVLFALATEAPSGPSFEVASVKRTANNPPDRPDFGVSVEEQIRFRGGPGTNSPERINYSGVASRCCSSELMI